MTQPPTRPLRIALVMETSGGGSGRHVLDLARGLAGAGHDVTVIWSPVRAQPDMVTALAAAQDITSIPLEMHRAVGTHDVASLRALAALLRGLPPFDILHGHSSKAGALVRLLPRSIPGARIYTPHAFRTMDPDLSGPAKHVYRMIEAVLARRSDRIIAVSQAEADHARDIGIAPERLSLVVNGAALPGEADPTAARAAARAEMGLGPDDIAVGFLGRLDAQKDPLRFVAAVGHAARTVPAIRGIVMGDGALRDAAERAAPEAHMRFMGWCDGPRLIRGLDIFCMTSLYEAMPYTLIEALHAQVPIITTAVGGARETVVPGETGYVLPLGSTAEEIGTAIARLAGDAATRAAFAEAEKRLAETRTIPVMVRETLGVYGSVLDRAPALRTA